MFNKYMLKIIKLLIIIASKFRKNQEMISNLIIWCKTEPSLFVTDCTYNLEIKNKNF